MKTLTAFCSLFLALFAVTAVAQEAKSDLFARLDANKDGKVVRDELPENQKPNFGRIDANSDGAISRDELTAYTRGGGEAIKPTHANVAYGPHERNKIDLYLVESKTPTPLVLYIHGGGFRGGDKSSVSPGEIRAFQREGWSVAAINYRFTNVLPAPGQYLDCGRALQFLRHHAQEYNLDPRLVASTGGSAGAGTSLWLAFHDDLADPKSGDPIARESSRLTCAAVNGAQTSLDPKELREWIANSIYGGHAFGFAAEGRSRDQEFELLIANREKVLPWIKEYSPIELVTGDDPPIYLDYPNQRVPPVIGQKEADPTHSAIYGVKLLEKLKSAGVEGVLSYPGHEDQKYGSITKFLIAKLQAK
jgi:acetyl esterase/lipase